MFRRKWNVKSSTKSSEKTKCHHRIYGNDLEKTVSTVFRDFINILITYPKLLIAVINGPAIGVGVTMLALFDMVYASHEAYFQTPFTRLGLMAEGCSTYTFPKIFGKSKAGDMLYLGYKMNALEAKQYGFVSELYKSDQMDEVWRYLETLSKLSSESILAIKRLVNKWDQKILLEVNAQESIELLERVQSSDFIERVKNLMFTKSNM
ncbi:enoyl-CoA delta isomerase 3, peroxisomal isoform X1 [Ceratina calcarata]|uniref:Enoyl-CoA delta isomerase 3, peroxisomal isoform X1 n=1 Tax=Ceratina calcarata TaxID=156304 RepID=A0AAJ7W9E2_9HYME|nr:enoyl-CoA delta isomerase 3, peroxisomal isoform X1 [Ceratina calcarata]